MSEAKFATGTEVTRGEAATDILLALLVLFVAAVVVGALSVALAPGLPPMLVFIAVQGLVVLAGVVLLLRRRATRWRDIGLVRLEAVDVLRALGALVLMVAVAYALTLLLELIAPGVMEAHTEGLTRVARMLVGELPFGVVIAGMLFVGFYEEVFARGFLLRRSRQLFGGIWMPVLISSILFGLGHAYQGWAGVVQTALIGVVLARLTLYWGTLWPAVLAHAALNTMTIALARTAGA
jgi:uncharacterized protein